MGAMMFDLNQVEILKGSQSSVFGANALAGAICLKSRNPDPFFGGHFILGYGSDNNQRVGLALNTPLSSKFIMRTGIFYSSGDGFRENLYLNRGDTNAKSEGMVRTKLNWTISRNLDIKITGMLSDLDNKYDVWAPDNNKDLHTYSDRQGYDSQRLSAVSVRSSFRYDSGHKILSISSKSRSSMEHSYDGDWGNVQFWEDEPYSWDSYYYGDYLPYDYYDKTSRDRETTSHELRLLSPDRGEKYYSYALGLYHKSLVESDQMSGWIFNGDVDQFDGEFNISNLALYGKVDVLFDRGLGVDLSARGEIVSLDYAATSLKDLDYDGAYDTSYTSSVDDMMNMLLGLKGAIYYDITESDRVFTSVSRGYKAGGVNQNPFISDENKHYDPEQNISFELGYKSFKEKSSYQATFFYMLRENLQVSVSAQQDPGNPGSFYYFTSNAASGHNYGAEYERSQVFLDDKLKLTSSIGYLRTWIDRYEFYIDNGTSVVRGNRAQSQSPEFSYSMITEIHPSESITISIDYSFKDKYFFSDSHDHRSDAYHLLSLSAEYKINSASISLWGKNVTDTRYAVRGFYFGLEPNNFEDKLYLQWGDPIHFGASLRYDF
jgi:outer membrane receptor protein involved in Fe transport